MNKYVVFWGTIGLMILSVSLGVVLLYIPGLVFSFYYIKPEYFGPLVIGSTFGHVATLIVVASVQTWIAQRYGPNEILDIMRKNTIDDIEPPD